MLLVFYYYFEQEDEAQYYYKVRQINKYDMHVNILYA